jgi:transitional endoplasmic reticulum ATPase
MCERRRIKLEVDNAYSDDVGRGIARVDPDTMLSLDASPGDIVIIEGDRSTPVKIWRSERGDWNCNSVFLDDITKYNARTETGETIVMTPIEGTNAEEVILQPFRGDPLTIKEDAIEKIKRQLLKRPAVVGDVLPIMLTEDDYAPLVVGKQTPPETAVIREETEIRITDALRA